MEARITADYVIIGAGSAGCALANRLSADPRNRVVLLEAGHDDRPMRKPSQFLSNLNIHIPAGWAKLGADPAVNWNYQSLPEPGVGGRTIPVPRGKVLGGSSAINGLVYVRGFPTDYDNWRQLGCTGWGWDDVLPIMMQMEDASFGDPSLRGRGGPIKVTKVEDYLSTIDAIIKATREAGYPETDDYNGAFQEGVTYCQQNSSAGIRVSAAAAYLHPVSTRKNLQIVTGAMVSRVIIEDGRAVGVQFTRNGAPMRVDANAEVILCAGAINSPVLLERSGVGAGERLRAMGIPVVADRQEVGENLQDHYLMAVPARLKDGTPSVNGTASGWPLLKSIVEYAVSRKGLLASASCTVNGFLRSRPEVDIPDIQFLAAAATVDRIASATNGAIMLDEFPGLTLGGWVLRPESRGSCHATTSAPSAAPAIQFNYLSTSSDLIDAVNLLRVIRNVLHQPSLAALVEHEKLPTWDATDDFDVLASICRDIGCSGDHPVGTCRMGSDDQSVVDPELRVRGIKGLRVADASIMPRLISGNTNAACMMIGEMASKFILNPS